MLKISSIQIQLIEKAKKYINKNSKENINVHSSGCCYFCAWGENPGFAILKLWQKGFKYIFNMIKIFCKDIISISGLYNYYLINKLDENKRYNKIIVSWGVKNGFLSDGSYNDRYFKINSRNTNETIWFLIYEDEVLPEKIDNNILIFKKSKSQYKYNFFYLFKNIIKKIISSKFSLKRVFHKISRANEFSSIVCNKLKNFITDDITTIIMPYECQPFQNKIFKMSKKINNKIKTIGYVHAFPVGLPTNYIFRDGSPEKLILNGSDQYYCFKNYLNWSNDKLKILPSTRFSKSIEKMSGYIYLPLSFHSTDIIIKSLKNLLNNYDNDSIFNLVVKNHPLTENSKRHLQIIKEIDNILSKNENSLSKENYDRNLSVFIGSTSSPIEALERGVKVIHICDDPVFQKYSSELWPSIQVKKINNNIYEYKLLKKGNLIQMSDSSQVFQNEYLN